MKIYIPIMMSAILMLSGCGSSNGGQAPTTTNGRLFDGGLSGVTYVCASGATGTLSSAGEYVCPIEDDTVTFYAGETVLGTTSTAAAIDPQMLSDNNETRLIEMTRLLIAADRDGNTANGINVDAKLYGTAQVDEATAVQYLEEHFGYQPSNHEAASSSSVRSTAASSEDGIASSAQTVSSSSSSYEYVSQSSASVSSEAGSSAAGTVSSSASSTAKAVGRHSPAVIETAPRNWYMRLSAEVPAAGVKSNGAQIGQLDEPNTAAKSLKALAPFGSGYVDVVFKDPYGANSGEYKSVFHSYQEAAADSWRFTVKTDYANSDVIVTWSGLYVLAPYRDNQGRIRYHETISKTNPLLKKIQVIDETSGKRLQAIAGREIPAFIVNMNGATSRTFRLELLTHDTQTVVTAAQSARLSELAQRRVKAVLLPTRPAFDLNKPPVFDAQK